MTIAEQIYAIVKMLPPDQASKILAFAEFIQSKHLTSVEIDCKKPITPESHTRDIIDAVWKSGEAKELLTFTHWDLTNTAYLYNLTLSPAAYDYLEKGLKSECGKSN